MILSEARGEAVGADLAGVRDGSVARLRLDWSKSVLRLDLDQSSLRTGLRT